MRMKLLLLLGILSIASVAHAQNFSNKGKDFWVGYGLHYMMEEGDGLGNSQNMVLHFSAEQEARVKVTITGEAPFTGAPVQLVRNYVVPANSTLATDYIPKSGQYDSRLYDLEPSFGGKGLERIYNRSVHIESDVPIVAYAYVGADYASAASMLIPTDSWGYSYVSLNSMQVTPGTTKGNGCLSWIFIVADHDNTVVEITPSVQLRRGAQAGVPFRVTLNRGQIYQVIGAPVNRFAGMDLTGTKVRSIENSAGTCYPVGVFSGSNITTITCNQTNRGYADNLFQQAFPVQAWGRSYVTAPFSSSDDATVSNSTIYRILVKDPATTVTKNGTVMTGLIDGTYYEYNSKTADLIEADQPIMVAQYMPSKPQVGLGNSGCDWSGQGDPDMVYLSPLEQAIKKVILFRNSSGIFKVNFLTLVIPNNGLTSLTIDGAKDFSHTYPHPNKPGYTVVVKRWPAANAQCTVQSDSAFTSVTYGVGAEDSYAYNGGAMLNNLNGIPQLHNPEAGKNVVHEYTCEGTPAELSILTIYEPTRLEWKLSEVADVTPSNDVTLNNPSHNGTVVLNGTTYYKYTLPGTYTFSKTGVYEIPVRSSHPIIDNCNHTEEFKLTVEVREKPGIAFSYLQDGCAAEPVALKWDETSAGDYTVNKWLWTFADGTTAATRDAEKIFNTSGEHQVKLKVVTEEGCVAETAETIELAGGPEVAITASRQELCEGATVDLTAVVPSGEDAYFTGWYWDLGNGSTATTKEVKALLYNTPGAYTVKMVGKSGAVCASDTARMVITVHAKPYTLFSYPQGCLPVDGVVQFISKASAPDGQNITSHAWNFGDPDATPANPNTSSLADPVHSYKFGNYTIRYEAATANGCRKDTTVSVTFSLKPQFRYDALAAVCEGDAPLSVAKAAVTNGVPGTGTYKGAGTAANGTFNPAEAGAGTHEIRYIYETQAGCIDSVSQFIEVYPRPSASFRFESNTCLNRVVALEGASTITSGSVTRWNWTFGDGRTDNSTGDQINISYDKPGNYNVSLVTVSNRNCTSMPFTRTIVVHPDPVAAFTLPSAVCMPGGEAAFLNKASEQNGAALAYEWTFGDGTGASTAKDPVYRYERAGNYTVGLRVRSEFGCEAYTSQVLSRFYDKPVAAFSVTPGNEVCQGGSLSFAVTPPGNTASAFEWSFGDGTSASVPAPTHLFTKDGVMDVTLKLTSREGCVSDPAARQVTVHPRPVIDAGRSFVVPEGTRVQFEATAAAGLSFLWAPEGLLNDPTALRPVHIVNSDQKFTVRATGAGGCIAYDSLTVSVLRDIRIPNVFSPNGDGINDQWAIQYLSDYTNATVEVFNRYGQRVFISTGYATPWNGTFNGKPLPVGTYYYVINLRNGFDPVKGSVTIIR